MQFGPLYRRYDPYHQVQRRHVISFPAKTIPDDALDPVPGVGPRHGFLSHDQTQSSAVHSIENRVQT